VNVTAVPEHVGFDPVVMPILTEGVTLAVTPKLIALDVAVVEVTQVMLLVITTVMLPAVVPASV
jgi:hypothetical protein